jgi:hypothetical protein
MDLLIGKNFFDRSEKTLIIILYVIRIERMCNYQEKIKKVYIKATMECYSEQVKMMYYKLQKYVFYEFRSVRGRG